jgi:hypothetical protein
MCYIIILRSSSVKGGGNVIYKDEDSSTNEISIKLVCDSKIMANN